MTDPWTQQILWVDAVSSTNDLAHELAEDPIHRAIVARQQTAGRGRSGRSWLSEPSQGLYLSWYTVPNLPPTEGAVLPLCAGVALHKCLETLGYSTQLKWPNDLLSHQKKLAGILCEARIKGNHWHAVIGIGLNLQPPRDGWPNALNATSLGELGGAVPERELLASRLLQNLTSELRLLETAGRRQLIEQWMNRGPKPGQKIRVGGREGQYRGLKDCGSLLADFSGNLEEVTAGDVELIS